MNSYYWDEVVYLHLSENIHNNFSYSSEIYESFRPPLLPFLMSFFISNPTLIHLLIIAFVLLTMITLYMFVKDIYDKDKALVAAALLVAVPLYFFWSNKLLTEAPSILLISLSLYFFYKYEKLNENKFLYITFILTALAFITKPLNVALIISLALYLLYKEKLKIFKQKKYYLAFLLFFLMLLPWFYLNIKNYGHLFGMLLYQLGLTITQPDYLFYVKNSLNNLSFVFFLFLFGLLSIRSTFRRYGFIYFYLITYLLLISVFIAHNTQNRFFLLLMPSILIISVTGYKNILKLSKEVSYKYLINILLIFLISINLYNGYISVQDDPANTQILIESQKELEKLEKGTALCNSIPYCYFFSKNNVIIIDPLNQGSFPDLKEDFIGLIEEENVKYLVVDNYHKEPAYKDYIDKNFRLIISKQKNYKYVKIYEVG